MDPDQQYSQPSVIHQIPDNSMDFIRLLLAGIVAVAHFMLLTDVPPYRDWAPFFDTTVAVMGFFILSGLLVTGSFFRSRGLGDYFVKRARRLLPAYIMVVVLCALLLSVASELSFEAYFTDSRFYRYLFFNLTFLNFLQNDLPGVFLQNPLNNAVNGSLWTLKIEVAFYFTLPVILYLVRQLRSKRKINLLFLGLYLFAILYTQLCDYAYYYTGKWFFQEIRHQLPGQFHYFSVGCAAYFNLEWIRRHVHRFVWPALFVFCERYVFGTTFLWPLALGVLLFFIAFRLPGLRKLTAFGDISYGVYIVHFPIAQLLVAGGLTRWSLGGSFIIYLILVGTVALLSWYLIEKRFLLKRKAAALP